MDTAHQNYPAFEEATSAADFDSSADYDSGWQPANNHSNNYATFDHDLGVIPSDLTIYFSVDQETAYPLTWSWSSSSSGNPVTILANDQVVQLAIYAGSPLHGVWNPNTGWTYFTQGYFRVFASK
jgi:hypothetical protein